MPVRISPPRDSKYEARARVIAIEPAFAAGQPVAWPATASTIPNDDDPANVSGTNECAAQPPKSARARSVRKRFATDIAERSACMPKRAITNG